MDPKDEKNIKVYEQLCTSYRAIDDFRAKLLGFLPLASAGGAFLLLNDVLVNSEKSKYAKPFLEPLRLFGFVVTLLPCHKNRPFTTLYSARKAKNRTRASDRGRK